MKFIIRVVQLYSLFTLCFCLTTYYVKPDSSKARCPDTESGTDNSTESGEVKPCKTLKEYLGKNYFSRNDSVFIFLCGTHQLSSVLKVRNVSNLFLRGSYDQDLCIKLTNTSKSVIKCIAKSGMVFIDSFDIHIKNININFCGASRLQSAFQMTTQFLAALFSKSLRC